MLDSTDGRFDGKLSFSPSGHFFACSTAGSDIYLWKEHPTGYVHHKTLSSSVIQSNPLFSQTEESFVVYGGHSILLWRTDGAITPPSGVLARAHQHTENFVLDFSPDGTYAAATMLKDNVVTVLDLKSGDQQLTINTDADIYGLRVVGSTLVVVTGQKVITWKLPTGECLSNPMVGLDHSSQIIEMSGWQRSHDVTYASISPDCNHIAFIMGGGITGYLCVYNRSTREYLEPDSTRRGVVAWFAPGGCDVWYANEKGVQGMWRVGSQDGPEPLVDHEGPPVGYPWRSSHGYWVTDDWWVCGPDGKKLLMLPPSWQSNLVRRMWKGQFLALLHRGLSEPVILELDS